MMPPPPLAGYGVLLADPCWRYEIWSEKGNHKSPERHYDTMPLDELAELRHSLRLDFCMAPDCVCVMWATFPMLRDSLRLMAAWGFEYKTGGCWGKRSPRDRSWAFGTGYIFRGAAELFLLGTRGNPAVLSKSERNLIIAPTRGHSRKPAEMHHKLAAMFRGPYLELFARQPVKGWDRWGDETDKFPEAA